LVSDGGIVPQTSIRVECYSDYRGEQQPLAFWLGERRLVVRAIVDRWFAPAERWFKASRNASRPGVCPTRQLELVDFRPWAADVDTIASPKAWSPGSGRTLA
jgi:hypothetical protein